LLDFVDGLGLSVCYFTFVKNKAMNLANMSQKRKQLLILLNRCEYKINELSAFRMSNNNGSNSKIIDNSQLCILEKHLEAELWEISKVFDVSRKSAIILCSMFFSSFLDTEGLVSRTISEEDLASSVCLDSYIISDLSNDISELENKNTITVTFGNDSTEKFYALTETFIQIITN